MKAKSSGTAVLFTTLIASGILLTKVSSAQPCTFEDSAYDKEQYSQASWLQTPWAMMLTAPGIALATVLSLGGRSYQG